MGLFRKPPGNVRMTNGTQLCDTQIHSHTYMHTHTHTHTHTCTCTCTLKCTCSTWTCMQKLLSSTMTPIPDPREIQPPVPAQEFPIGEVTLPSYSLVPSRGPWGARYYHLHIRDVHVHAIVEPHSFHTYTVCTTLGESVMDYSIPASSAGIVSLWQPTGMHSHCRISQCEKTQKFIIS